MVDEISIRFRYQTCVPALMSVDAVCSPRRRPTAGHGGIAGVARATGIARSTIGRGLEYLEAPEFDAGMVRRAGGGRLSLTQIDPTLLADLRRHHRTLDAGRSDATLAVGVEEPRQARGGAVRHGASGRGEQPARLLEHAGYRRQVNRKTQEGSHHPDRDAQFEHINRQAVAFLAAGQPVISVDTKKKELIGDFKNAGGDYRPEGCPDEVNVHDFIDKELGKAVPYGVYDIDDNRRGCRWGSRHGGVRRRGIHRWLR